MASYGGRDEETLDEAKQRAPAAIRARCRAVTADDFEFFATQAANIARARALPLRHPDFPGVQVPGVVTVLVVPDSDEPDPMPSEGTLRTVCAYLDQRRLLTTELYVAPPTYQEVSVDVELVADDCADLAEVQRDVEQTLLDYFHPLRGRRGRAGLAVRRAPSLLPHLPAGLLGGRASPRSTGCSSPSTARSRPSAATSRSSADALAFSRAHGSRSATRRDGGGAP